MRTKVVSVLAVVILGVFLFGFSVGKMPTYAEGEASGWEVLGVTIFAIFAVLGCVAVLIHSIRWLLEVK